MYNRENQRRRKNPVIEHRVVACRLKRSKVEKTCDKMGKDGWAYAGNFVSSFLLIFRRNYLVFLRSSH